MAAISRQIAKMDAIYSSRNAPLKLPELHSDRFSAILSHSRME